MTGKVPANVSINECNYKTKPKTPPTPYPLQKHLPTENPITLYRHCCAVCIETQGSGFVTQGSGVATQGSGVATQECEG